MSQSHLLRLWHQRLAIENILKNPLGARDIWWAPTSISADFDSLGRHLGAYNSEL